MHTRQLSSRLKALYAAAAALAVGAAFMTFVLTERTGDYFAWPIEPPLTAAAIGACYVAAVVLLTTVARGRTWAEGRLAAPPVMVISLLLLAATLLHWDRFAHDRPVFWFWLAAYVLVPPALALLVREQRRAPADVPLRTVRLPAWARAGLALHAVVLLGFGAVMVLHPPTAQDLWSWALTPLTSRALGAFVVGFGVIAALVAGEGRLAGLEGPALAYAALGVAQLVALARYPDDLGDDAAATWALIGFLATAVAGGLLVAWLARRARVAGRMA